MVLKFDDAPLAVDRNPDCVVIIAQDTDSGEHVECRIMYDVLIRKFGAESLLDRDKFLKAFNDNREEILAVAQRKYTQGSVERNASGVRLFLELEDFDPI